MPTGYTAALYEGEEQSPQEFILSCARAFGALVTMRDDPADAAIPDEFQPDTRYYDESIAEAQQKIERLRQMTGNEIVAEAKQKHDEAVQQWWEEHGKSQQRRARYLKMLSAVEAWTPPTEDHFGLKKFMREQIEESIRFDCRTDRFEKPDDDPYFGTYLSEAIRAPETHRSDEIARLREQIERWQGEREKEIKRAQDRTAWVRALKESVQGVPA